jgi:hypothetical protein
VGPAHRRRWRLGRARALGFGEGAPALGGPRWATQARRGWGRGPRREVGRGGGRACGAGLRRGSRWAAL